MNQLQYLTDISKKDNKYFLRFAIPETKVETFALPVYTNAKNMTGVIHKSLVYKTLAQTEKTKLVVPEPVEVSADFARYLLEIAQSENKAGKPQRFESVNGWKIEIK